MTYKIFHGPGVVHFFEKNSTAVSGQPNQEEFENETDAVSRVLELDADFYPQWGKEETYRAGNRVKFGNCIYRALQEDNAWQMVYNPEFEEFSTLITSLY